MSESTSSKPMYEKIFDDVKRQILDQSYKPGDRIPSEKELAEEYQVSRITSKRALEMLAAEHIIVRNRGAARLSPIRKPMGQARRNTAGWTGPTAGTERTGKSRES
ncbi:hypothetical protein HMSSN139_55580 [Paenibacillus sp. HMSSN-139]|nr:hypothetical protein HMSSN139_55580 [Paenibacillus sp. HMSSN-139]